MINDCFVTEYSQDAVRYHSTSGSFNAEHTPVNVLKHKNAESEKTFWMAQTGTQDWFILDLGTQMSYSKVRMANTWCPSWFDGSSDSFRWDHFIYCCHHIINGHGRVSVTNNPDVEAEWEVVLERSFPLDDDSHVDDDSSLDDNDWNINGEWQGSGSEDPPPTTTPTPPFQTDTGLKE